MAGSKPADRIGIHVADALDFGQSDCELPDNMIITLSSHDVNLILMDAMQSLTFD
jgi:hypothetical protein